jgi:hypothetical protein
MFGTGMIRPRWHCRRARSKEQVGRFLVDRGVDTNARPCGAELRYPSPHNTNTMHDVGTNAIFGAHYILH